MQSPSPDTGVVRRPDITVVIRRNLRSRSEQAAAFRRFGLRLIEPGGHDDVIPDLTRAELTREISEFQALFLRAILAMIEGADSARVHDYLEMAEAVTDWPHERAAIIEARESYDERPADLQALAVHCLASLDVLCQVCGWIAA